MTPLIDSGRDFHCITISVSVESADAAVVNAVINSSQESVKAVFSGVGSGLQIRHRRFGSDRSLFAKDPRDVPELTGIGEGFAFLSLLMQAFRCHARIP